MSRKKLKPKYNRIIFISISILSSIVGLYLIFSQFNNNIVFFFSPAQISLQEVAGKTIRVGGLVREGTVNKNINNTTLHRFVITDNKQDLLIEYNGMLPNLFRENQGVVAKGKLTGNKFVASELLAKHDEKYMPKEVADSLKEQGLYRNTGEKAP
ncbi:cytochrome c maturation protein CcmE [Rickettsiales endosymbiont of Stachyamoeba lipophora]|uniref:cytochrome c maturation protein CcmE n=1 Tax=Rickettsiales endosymbiont of Stachyamoeba lipophora TaxID=2486578 RepID=UPI000F653A7B|nr:cytochrome c maturation protein CcmE [Rickettsiales endosymbiont of Stachyamoeba lipophora]AZL16048.1 cytochrome c maturation protein CcmE [Rickettsiales endosymbiont of Stachyamoeba lipophora]